MVIMIETGLIVLGLVILFGTFLIFKSIKHFVVNAVIGLLILFASQLRLRALE